MFHDLYRSFVQHRRQARLLCLTGPLAVVLMLAALSRGESSAPANPSASDVSVSGVILDGSGHPVVEVEIYPGREAATGSALGEIVRTDHKGRFSVSTDEPFIVFRKPGFESQRVPSASGPRRRQITLARATRKLPVCSAGAQCASLPGGKFCFPPIADVWVNSQYSGADSIVRYFLPFHNRKTQLKHDCCEYMCTDGLPVFVRVMESSEYQETVYGTAGLTIIDAKGIRPAGKNWRFLGRPGEYAAYDLAEQKDAALLHKVLDGVCIKNQY